MYPWLWLWAPRIQYPYSGALSQWVQPSTNWFFDAIEPQAGIGEIEKKVFDVATYGRQLGLITEVLLAMKGNDPVSAEKAQESLDRLREIYRDIEKVKEESKAQVAEAADALLAKMLKSDPERLEALLARVQLQLSAK